MRVSVGMYGWIFSLLCCVVLPAHVRAEEHHAAPIPMLFSSLKNRMSYLGERQAVLAKNIANANTPEYKAQDLQPFKDTAGNSRHHKLKMRATNFRHLSGSTSATINKFETIKDKDADDITLSGNNVSLDKEMRKAAENNLDYQETTSLYKKWAGVMHTAVTGSKQ